METEHSSSDYKKVQPSEFYLQIKFSLQIFQELVIHNDIDGFYACLKPWNTNTYAMQKRKSSDSCMRQQI